MELQVLTIEGKDSGTTQELDEAIYSIEPNKTLLYEDVRRFQNNKRNGNASTKERGQVRGGGRKAYRQKGTGMARRGTIRSPLLKGGGTTHGPRPRSYKHGLPVKMRRLARMSALSIRQSKEQIRIVENLDFDKPSTKVMANMLSALGIANEKVLLLTGELNYNAYLSARNIPNIEVLEARNVTTYHIMNANCIVIEQDAVAIMDSILTDNMKETKTEQ